jgi:hypothetical protein
MALQKGTHCAEVLDVETMQLVGIQIRAGDPEAEGKQLRPVAVLLGVPRQRLTLLTAGLPTTESF